jgi:hypothetical protein
MRWEDAPPRKAINLGAAFGVPDDPTPFRVSVLRVPQGEPLPAAFVELLRRVLTEGVAGCSAGWEVLLFQMNLLGGGFTCVFTTHDLTRDEPPVFKLSSAEIEEACRAIPETEPGDPQAEREFQKFEDGCLELLRQAARSEFIAERLRELRSRHTHAVWVCDFYRTTHVEIELG